MSEQTSNPSQDPTNQDNQALTEPEILKYQKEWLQMAQKLFALAADKTQPIDPNQKSQGKEMYLDLPDMMVKLELYGESYDDQYSQEEDEKPMLYLLFLRKYSKNSGIFDVQVTQDGDSIKIRGFGNYGRPYLVNETNSARASEVSKLFSDILNNPDAYNLIMEPHTAEEEFAELSMQPDEPR